MQCVSARCQNAYIISLKGNVDSIWECGNSAFHYGIKPKLSYKSHIYSKLLEFNQ